MTDTKKPTPIPHPSPVVAPTSSMWANSFPKVDGTANGGKK